MRSYHHLTIEERYYIIREMQVRAIAAELQRYGCQTTAQNLSLFLRKQR